MSSENSPTSPRDNIVCIPTICLDSLNDSCDSSDQFYVASDGETDQSFAMNVSNFLSWLSYFGSQRRFLVAAILTASCDDGFRRALQLLNSSEMDPNAQGGSQDLSAKANDCDYLAHLNCASMPPGTLADELLKLLPHLSLPPATNIRASSRRISTASTVDHTKDSDLSAPRSPLFGGSQLQLCSNSEKTQPLKKQYLSLIADTISHDNDGFDLKSCENLLSLSDNSVKELVMRQPLSQLLLKVFLHPGFTRDDRNWLCSLIRVQQQSVNSAFVAARNDSPPAKISDSYTATVVRSKAFDCLLEALTDLSAVLNSPTSNSIGSAGFVSSLSPSLASSGFLSGCGGAGSQYDLLSEAANGYSSQSLQNGSSQYGKLLTVPTPDPRAPNNHLGITAYPGLAGALEQRRLSDVPYFLSQSLATTALGSEAPEAQPCPDDNNQTRAICTSVDFAMNSTTYAKSLAGARASLPNALATQDPVETITEHTSDSVSLSSASSNFSSNLDLRPVLHHHHRPGASPGQSSGRAGARPAVVSTHESSHSLPPSPPSTVVSMSPGIQTSSLSNRLTSSVLHTDPPRIANATYPVLDRSFNDHDLFEPAEFDGVESTCAPEFGHGLDSIAFVGHNSSPVPRSFHEISSFPGNLFRISSSRSPMSAVPSWLKSLRLHKYADLFQRLSYDEFMAINESWLEERNVTQGARTKLLLNIRKLAMRGSLLQQVEADLLQTQSAGPALLSTLRTCMTEIWNILHTPMAPCLSPPPAADPSCKSRLAPLENDGHENPTNAALEVNITNGSAGSLVHKQTPSVEQEGPHIPNAESLPSRIMSCLTKVCSRLLVSSQPDPDCCENFIQLLDIISGHPAFSDKQKSLTASWRQQMFNLLDTIPFQSTSDPSRSSRSVPRSYHGRPFRKPPCRFHPRSKKGAVSCCSAVPTHDTSTLMSVAISDVPCTTSSYTAKNSTDQGLGEPKAGLSVHQMQGYSGGTGHAYHPVCSFDDSLHRRHSVPVDQVRPGPPPIRSCQGRRMPSPNPAFMPSRNTQFFFPGPPQASSSDADVSQSAAMQLPCTRFPSPSSAYENTYPSGCPRSLIPPATAPPTRMPSPSGMRKLSAGLPPCPQEIAASLLLTVPTSPCQITSTCPCIPSLGFSSRVDECARTMPMVLHNTAGSLPPQVCLGTDFQQQPHSVFQRNALLPNSSTSLDCICISPGLSDLHQTCSLQTPSNPYVCAIIVNRQVGHGLDAVRTIPPQSCTPHALGRTSYPSASHDHTNLRQSLHSVSGCNYRSPLRDSHSSGTHVITPPGSDTQGTNALASDDRTEWGVSGADRVFSFHPVYATAGNPCTVTSLATSATSEVETGTDFIEHNLDLLTRKVTELAIGEFDSPGE